MSATATTTSFESPLSRGGVLGTFSPALALLPGALGLLRATRILKTPGEEQAASLDAVVSWAHDPNEALSRAYAERHRLPWLRVAPGFLYRVGVRGDAEPPLSLIVDDLGIYDDARGESRLERWLNGDEAVSGSELTRARELMKRLLQLQSVSQVGERSAQESSPTVVVIDEPREACALERLCAAPEVFEHMLDAALREHPEARILIIASKAANKARARGWLSGRPDANRVQLVRKGTQALSLLEGAAQVYTVGAQLGFEALLRGKRVTCFGVPWYAGWGLTDDRVSVPRRSRKRSLEELVFIAYLRYARYADPELGEPWECEQALAFMERQHRFFALNRGHIYCHGFTMWKRNFVRAYLRSPGNRITFIDSAAQAERRGFGADSKLLVWGTREEPEVTALAARKGVPVWRMEDGFLRSVGLGADLTIPASLVVDREGIYFDPNAPSELESILQNEAFSADELSRAQALRALIVETAISKYNVGDAKKRLERPAGDKRVILVPGQVEDDASIRRGCRDLRTNAELLEAVRARNPNAHVIFKPHPDVTNARREGAVPEQVARKFADQILLDVPLPACLAIADEVHTLTSLVGFEALLRGLSVFAYGQPFYAGWGLTTDLHPVARRTRQLSVDELVAGVLLRYPRYLGRRTRMFTTPEVVVKQLHEQMLAAPAKLSNSRIQREMRRVLHVLEGVLDVP